MADTAFFAGYPRYILLPDATCLISPHNVLNSSRPMDKNIHNLVQMTSCHLFRAKPLYEPMMDNCQLDPWEHISVTFELKYNNFHTINLIEKYHLQNDCHFVSDTPDYFSGAPFHIFNQDLLLTAPTQFFYHHGDQIAVGIIQSDCLLESLNMSMVILCSRTFSIQTWSAIRMSRENNSWSPWTEWTKFCR